MNFTAGLLNFFAWGGGGGGGRGEREGGREGERERESSLNVHLQCLISRVYIKLCQYPV